MGVVASRPRDLGRGDDGVEPLGEKILDPAAQVGATDQLQPPAEALKLRVGAWILNAANHPNYNDPPTNISSVAAVGVITSVPSYWVGQTPTPRMMEVSLRLDW